MRTVFLVLASLFVAAVLFLFGLLLAGWGVWLVGDIFRGVCRDSVWNYTQALGLVAFGLGLLLLALALPAIAFWAPSLLRQAGGWLHHTTTPRAPTAEFASLCRLAQALPEQTDHVKTLAGALAAKQGGTQ